MLQECVAGRFCRKVLRDKAIERVDLESMHALEFQRESVGFRVDETA